jgi:hypothetical protein
MSEPQEAATAINARASKMRRASRDDDFRPSSNVPEVRLIDGMAVEPHRKRRRYQ